MLAIDNLLRALRAVALHPCVICILLLVLVFRGASPSPFYWDFGRASLLILVLSFAACVWTLSLNRLLSNRALNSHHSGRVDWTRELVVVTGGSQGVGAELVRKLEAQGAQVAVLDIRPPTYKASCKVHYFECDVSSIESTSKARHAIVTAFGQPPTMLVANAGVVRGGTILEASEHDIRTIFAVNVLGVLWSVKIFLPDMIAARHGHVLVTSSATAFLTGASVVGYSASKAAIISLVEGLQTELKWRYNSPGVAISTILPATIATTMFWGIQRTNGFFVPTLSPEQVAERMMEILCEGKSAMVMMPAVVHLLPWLRVLPHWVRIAAQDGMAHSMDNLHPRI